MAEPSGGEEYARESDCQIEYGFVDHNAIGVDENVESGVNQNEGDMDNHDRYCTRASNNELAFSENNDLAAVENQGIDADLKFSAEDTEYLMGCVQSFLEEKQLILDIDDQLWKTGQNFKKNIVKSGKDQFTVTCANEGCPWLMRVEQDELQASSFECNIIHPRHTCGVIAHPAHQRASVQQVASSVDPHYMPTETFEDSNRVHGMPLSHEQALRHQKHYMALAPGSVGKDYSLLSEFCDKVRQTNPRSLASLSVDPIDASSFRLFISYQASIYGFLNACRPLIGLESTVLKNKYLLNLLFATGFDGDGAIFPLALGIVGQENENNWSWFLFELQSLLETRAVCTSKLTILSDRRSSIVSAVGRNFPTAYHRFYMPAVSDLFMKLFHHSPLVTLLWKAANALDLLEFDLEVRKIEQISQEAARWVRKLPPDLWATSHFKGTCFQHPRVRIAEALNAWILDAKGLPIVQVMECIHHKMMKLFNERREASMKWTSVLVPSAERQVSKAIHCARSYRVLIRKDEFLVIYDKEKEVVDIRSHCCSCQEWQQFGLPCSHAAAALLYCRQNVRRFSWSCFMVATYREAYSQSIHPLPPDIVFNTAKLQKQGKKRRTQKQ